MSLRSLLSPSLIPSVNSQGTRAWELLEGDTDGPAIEDGALVLSITDLYDAESDAVTRWALAIGLMMDDIPADGALHLLLFRTICKALADVPTDSPLVRAMTAVREGGPSSLLPDFRVVVDGRFASLCVVEAFAGPFADFDDLLHGVDRRLASESPLRVK